MPKPTHATAAMALFLLIFWPVLACSEPAVLAGAVLLFVLSFLFCAVWVLTHDKA